MKKDYFILKRSIVSDQLYFLEKFSKFQAWQDLIYLANWNTGSVKQGLDVINLERGELCHAENYLCQRWRWSKGKVRRFLNWLVKDERLTIRQIVTETNQRRNVLKLVNYDKHQIPLKYSSNTLDNIVSHLNSKETNNNTNNKPNNSLLVEEILKDLNEKTGKNFRPKTKAYQTIINARISEGYSKEDFIKVNTLKVKEWKNNSKFSKFLRPATLYCAKHFDSYLNSQFDISENFRNEEFNSLYNSSLIKDDSLKTARKLFRYEISCINNTKDLKNRLKSISKDWREDEKMMELFNDRLNFLEKDKNE